MTDFVDAVDFDGDGIADAVAWTPGTDPDSAVYRIRRSSRPGDEPVSINLGMQGDAASMSADFDGDGREDLALARFPTSAGPGRLFIYYAGTGAFDDVPIGEGTPFSAFSMSGDFTGNGIAELAVQRTNPSMASQGLFTIYRASDGQEVDSFGFGLNTDLIIPGNFVGDPTFDVTTGRNEGGARVWRSRNGSSGVAADPVTFGVGTDFLLVGDYDGDGLSDHAVFRGSPLEFRVRPSTAPATTWVVPLGAAGDYPVANGKVQ